MYDTIEKLDQSTIQHGKSNDRIYLMKLAKDDYPAILDKIEKLANKMQYSKIFAKIPKWAVSGFVEAGFTKEAHIPQFYNGEVDALFYGKFLSPKRAQLDAQQLSIIKNNIKLAREKQGKNAAKKLADSFDLRELGASDTTQLADLYRTVFASYPFPIFEEAYLKKTMAENIVYFGVFKGKRLIAASSAEMDVKSQNVEMTDFATHPDFTGNNLSVFLLQKMEEAMQQRGMKTLYTIARSLSPGMNITFAKLDYKFSGTLVNNTNIFGTIESMNVWYKRVAIES